MRKGVRRELLEVLQLVGYGFRLCADPHEYLIEAAVNHLNPVLMNLPDHSMEILPLFKEQKLANLFNRYHKDKIANQNADIAAQVCI